MNMNRNQTIKRFFPSLVIHLSMCSLPRRLEFVSILLVLPQSQISPLFLLLHFIFEPLVSFENCFGVRNCMASYFLHYICSPCLSSDGVIISPYFIRARRPSIHWRAIDSLLHSRSKLRSLAMMLKQQACEENV